MRYRIAGSVAVVCAIVALSACAGPTLKQFTSHPKQTTAQSEELRAIWLDSWLKDMSLLVSAGHRIAVAARAECGDRVKPWVGAFGANRMAFTKDYWRAAQARGIGAAFKIISVVPGSPADAAGLWPGDIILEVAGRRIAEDGPALAQINTLLKANAGDPRGTEFVVLRDGWELVLLVKPVPGCDVALVLLDGREVYAFTDSNAIAVSQNLVRSLRNESELAMIMAHELSHRLLDHAGSKVQNAVTGAVIGFTLDVAAAAEHGHAYTDFTQMGYHEGAYAYHDAFEAEADYLALYLVARAGYGLDAAVDGIDRLESLARPHDQYVPSHFPRQSRRSERAQMIEEIARKRAAGAPLSPDRAN